MSERADQAFGCNPACTLMPESWLDGYVDVVRDGEKVDWSDIEKSSRGNSGCGCGCECGYCEDEEKGWEGRRKRSGDILAQPDWAQTAKPHSDIPLGSSTASLSSHPPPLTPVSCSVHWCRHLLIDLPSQQGIYPIQRRNVLYSLWSLQ